VYHRFVIAVEPPLDPLIKGLEARGVQCRRPVFRPLHRALGRGEYPQAEGLWERSLSIPCYPALTDADARRVSEALVDALEKP
jgi:dTDP-4-amino-4,6-dideoxygalactose transaminase